MRGGILPDTYCSTKQGIPSNVGADLCVGIALDALEDADAGDAQGALAVNTAKGKSNLAIGRRGGTDGGSPTRKTLTQGIMKVD